MYRFPTLLYYVLGSISFTVLPLQCYSRPESNNLQQVFLADKLRLQCADFVDNVLRMMPSQELFTLADPLVKKDTYQSEAQLYKLLVQVLAQRQSYFDFYAKLQSLYHQKDILSKQARELLGNKKTIDGCVEIGSPGTYMSSLKDSVKQTGTRYVVHDKQRMTDSFQAFSINPVKGFVDYDVFVPLNDYAPISKDAIADESVDLVICFIGLHHIPLDKLDPFIASIQRILRPGGTFLLRDHDAQSTELVTITDVAHTLFNALVSQASAQEELAEFRNFQPLNYWIELLEQHGFTAGSKHLLQEGDPTLNTMVAFKKTVDQDKAIEQKISQELHNKPGYKRALIQTYLSSPEWFNVDISQAYGAYINHTPFYCFPYFSSIKTFWELFIKSWRVARKKSDALEVVTSPSTLMNLFIGVTMTLEYTAKGLVSLPVRLMYQGEEALTLSVLIKDSDSEVAGIDDKITIHKTYDDGPYVLAELPRYKEFLPVIKKLTSTNIELVEIAGQTEIQIKVRYPSGQQPSSFGSAVTKEYEWTLPTDNKYTYAGLTVPVAQLIKTVDALEHAGVEVLYIHDY